MMKLLTVNAGSSSLKLAVFRLDEAPVPLAASHITGVTSDAHAHALQQGLDQLGRHELDVVVHRIVHGGAHHHGPEMLNDAALDELAALIPLAPLHQPAGLQLVAACKQQLPRAAQYACYDTDFHRGLPPLQYRVPLPSPWPERGVRHYGFHGISYQYLYQRLKALDPDVGQKRVVFAHLGAGASLCAVHEGRSVATTMGFSALDGLPMATRSGRLDAGIVLYLMRQGLDADALESLLYRQSGLKALSGISGDMKRLLDDGSDAAQFAVDYFCDRVAREVAAMASVMGGIDALVFSGGIGEHAAPVRVQVMQRCEWLGVQLDASANRAHAGRLSTPASRVSCYRLVSDEAQSMAEQVSALLTSS